MMTGRRSVEDSKSTAHPFLFCAAIESFALAASALKVLRFSALVLPSPPSVREVLLLLDAPRVLNIPLPLHPLRHPRPPCRQTSILSPHTPLAPLIPLAPTSHTPSPTPPLSSTRPSSSPRSSPSQRASPPTRPPTLHLATPSLPRRRTPPYQNKMARPNSSPRNPKPHSSQSSTRTSIRRVHLALSLN